MNQAPHLHDSAPPPALHVRVLSAPHSSSSSLSSSAMSSSASSITRSERSSHARAALTAAAVDAQFVLRRGYLRLRDAARDWRMRTWCCVLLRHELRWYATERDARQARRPLERVVVVAARRSDGIGKLHVYPHAFTIETQDGRVLFCSAPSEEDQRRWIDAVNTGATAASAPNGSSGHSDRSTFVERGMSLRDDEVDAEADVSTSDPIMKPHQQSSSACAYRDHFITFVMAFTAKAILKIRADRINVGHVLSRSATTGNRSSEQEPDKEGRDELIVLLSDPARFTVPNVLCLLKKHLDEPRQFVRALALLIPLMERDPQSVEEYWVQLLTLFVPLLQTREPFSPAMQFFLRFVFAACRRSNTFALRTMWECLAFHQDARQRGDRVTMSYLMLLLHSSSAFYGNSTFVMSKLLHHAPDSVASQISKVLEDFLKVRDVLRDEIPDSLPAQWFNALCCHEIAIVCTGANVGLIETLRDSQSVDSVKKQYGSLAEYFIALFGADETSPPRVHAQEAFISSMAASSIFCYLFQLATVLHLSTHNSPLPCFQTQKPAHILRAFRERLFHHEDDDEVAKSLILRLIDKSYNNWRMRKYDSFQLKSNGILP
ncbi:hypothetical protein ATCC90586_000577 [Pythium insidiosum]|nr:hypothetical protein ATCC90586_000577 [Pythium insidiosum]